MSWLTRWLHNRRAYKLLWREFDIQRINEGEPDTDPESVVSYGTMEYSARLVMLAKQVLISKRQGIDAAVLWKLANGGNV